MLRYAYSLPCCISNKGRLEECDKDENVVMTGSCNYFLFEKKTKMFKSSVTYSPSDSQAGTPIVNTQSTLRTAPDLCKNINLQYILVPTVIHIPGCW